MSAVKKSKALEPAELLQLVDEIRSEICDKGKLIEIALEKVADENTTIAMLKAIGRSNSELFSLTEPLENSLEQSSLAYPFDRWIKVTPETMPPDQTRVDIFTHEDDYVVRAFYDADDKKWHSTHDGLPFEKVTVKYWRIGSLPLTAKGGV